MSEPSPELQNQRRESLVSELRSLLGSAFETAGPVETQNRILAEVQKLESKYPDLRTYALYHLLIGSTPPDGIQNFDLPGGEIEKFIRALAGKRAEHTQH